MQGKIEGSIKKLRAIEEEEEEDEAEDLEVSRGSEASKPSPTHSTVADEVVVVSRTEAHEKSSEKHSLRVRTRAKKSGERDPSSDKAKKGDQSGSGFVNAFGDAKAVDESEGSRVSPRNKKMKGESEGAGVEPETSKCDKSYTDKVKKGDQSGSGFVGVFGDAKAVDESAGSRVSPRNKKRKGESEGAGVEPETSKFDKSSSDKAKEGDQCGSGFVEVSGDAKAVEKSAGSRVSPRKKKGKGESEGAGVEPETSKCDKSVRRSDRISTPQTSSRVSMRSSSSRSVTTM